jgi:cytochrome c553
MRKALASLAVAIALLLSAAAVVGAEAPFTDGDVRLFRVKCGLCHGLDETFDEFPGLPLDDRAAVIADMRGRKPGWISEPEGAAIAALLSAEDLGGLAAAVERQAGSEERARGWTRFLPIAHGALMLAVFLALGIAVALSGLRRLFDKKRLLPRFPGSFVWKRHVLKGKIYVPCVLAGLCFGLAIWALDGFSIGAAPHFIAGCAVGALFAIGGVAGLRLAAGKGTPALRGLHAACNLTATALFAFNVVSGLILVYALVG